MAANRYSHLLSPGRIGSMELRSRIVVTAMGVGFAEEDGVCGERIRAYHGEQARGGAALIITGASGVAWPVGGVQSGQIAVSDDRFLPGLTALAAAVHAHGAKLAFQLHHAGPVSMVDMLTGRPVYVPSVPEPPKGNFAAAFLPEELAASAFGRITSIDYREMTVDDIRRVVEQFASAAERIKRAGADGVEIHGGHGYLLCSFLSPQSNRRTDDYGGTPENRARLLLEVICAVREAVGADFPVWVKLDSREEGKAGGITIEDAMRTARMVEAAGAVAITVTAYHDTDIGKLHSASHTPHEPGVNLPYAAQIKAAVGVPVIASGRIEPEMADTAIRDGQADFISMGRKLLADPHLPRKLTENQVADIRPCIYCYTCISKIYTYESACCAVNPEMGFEYLVKPARTIAAKHIVVVGGGPSGMEAARRLDAAGHQVTLLEKGDQLGGTLRFASLAYDANERLLDWLKRQIEASRVAVRLGTEATVAVLQTLKPDAVVVATGPVRGMPPIPGNDLPHVFSGDDLRHLMLGEDSDELKRKTGSLTRLATRIGAATGVTANLDFVRKATRQWMPLGQNIVIIGGQLVGLELAEFLTERGRRVTVVDDLPVLGAGLSVVRRMRLLDELAEHGVALHRQVKDIRIEAEVVRFIDQTGQSQSTVADHVIVAKGASGDLSLADRLRSEGYTVHAIGDCTGIGYIEGAMRGAAKAVGEIA